jgi:cell division protein FtsQ
LKKPQRELIKRQKNRLRVDKKPKTQKTTVGGDGVFARAVKWFLIVGFTGLAGLVLAAFFTPLLAVEEVEVVGTERLNAASVSATLEVLQGVPLTMVSDDKVAELLNTYELVETFAIQAQPPHTLRIKIRERQPIVIIPQAGKNLLFDPAGIKIGEVAKGDRFPYLKLTGSVQENPQFETAVEILLGLPLETYDQIFSLEVSQKLTAVFKLRDSEISVIWGDASDATFKAEVLQTLLATGQKNGVTIDVSSPSAPVVTHP